MAREQPEMGYWVLDGLVHHGLLEHCNGQRITEADAIAIAAKIRANTPVTADDRLRNLEVEISALKAAMNLSE